jgi:predicted DNA-binding transcriptional regulator AlpA
MPNSVAAQSKRGTSPRSAAHLDRLTQEDLRCLSLREWAKLCGFSYQTAKRLVACGEGPAVVQLSPKRIGIRTIDAARWSEARIRA